MELKFPKGFYWGSSTSAHQVEGDNHNDWSEWEKSNAERLAKEAKNKYQTWQLKKFPEMLKPEGYLSGKACDHYNRYEKDLDIAKSLGHNAHRFSIEWSRIEPEEGKFDGKAAEHYRKVLQALKKRGIEPFVTLWHWTNPVWIAKIGALENRKFSFYFSRYAGYLVGKLKKEVKFWITINEPTVLLTNSYLLGIWPPQKKSFFSANRVYKNLAEAHKQSYRVIKKIDSSSSVGFAHNIKFIEPQYRLCVLDQLAAKVYRYLSNDRMFLLVEGKYDFVGLNYYFHERIRFYLGKRNDNKEVTDMNWEIYPEGIYHTLKNLGKYDKPIYITENGLADSGDRKRKKFIEDHLFWVHQAISEGVDVRGYFYWSLLDNFEWDKGFWPRFGLISVDYKTQKRTVRKSALEYAKICRTNTLIEK